MPASYRLAIVLLLFTATTASAQQSPRKSADVSAALSMTALRPGDSAIVAVVVDIHQGLHAQSHSPLAPNLIALLVKLDDHPAVEFKEPAYPPGEIETYPQLGRMSVYTGRAIIRVPLNVKSGAALGSLKITGRVRFQACNDRACFAPETQTFELNSEIVATGSATQANQPELFATPSATGPTTAAATQPAISHSSITPPPPRVFGRDLGQDAYLLAFAGAFVVGIIFNAMPCVLPVVPLKIMGFYEVSQHNRGKSLALGGMFSLGLIASFGVLALLIVALRVVDWGGLFQQTWFTLAIVTALVLMAVSQFGLFTVGLPGGIYRFTPRHDTYFGNFLFGVLTAALSTPCTFGMFVGLLAWALKQPPTIGVALIMMVGVGMAFPYLLLSAMPEVARKFPRAGPWSEVIKQVMGFMILATAVYFARPLFQRFVSNQLFWWTLFAVVAAGCAFLVARAFQLSPNPRPRVIAAVIALLVFIPSLWATQRLTIRPYEWQPYSEQALQQALSTGKLVLVDFTADWCGNCHWLEASVLHDPKVIAAVHDQQAVMMKADVTNDDALAKPLLNSLNPAGAIPLTAIYSPRSPEPFLLDGIYSVDDLLNAFSAATGG